MGLGGKAHDVFVSNIAQFTDHQTGTKINTTPAALFVNSLITWRGSKREVSAASSSFSSVHKQS